MKAKNYNLWICLIVLFLLSCENQQDNSEATGVNNDEPEVGVDAPGAQMEDYAHYTTWDENNSGFIEENEYNNTIGHTNIFNSWDEDNDNQISEGEFQNRWKGEGNLGDWDQNNNGSLDESEFKRGSWSSFNENNDEGISEEEFNRYLRPGV